MCKHPFDRHLSHARMCTRMKMCRCDCARAMCRKMCVQQTGECMYSGAEMANVEQLKKIVPFVTCEITFGQNVCELIFGINVSNLNFRIKINLVKQPIESNSVGS